MINSVYSASEDRYDCGMKYRRCGRSGLKLPAISLGLWHNFGDITPFGTQQKILRTAFDNGITHFWEHVLFRNINHLMDGRMYEEIDKLGLYFNQVKRVNLKNVTMSGQDGQRLITINVDEVSDE